MQGISGLAALPGYHKPWLPKNPTLTITGSSLMATSVVHWGCVALATPYISPTQLNALIPAATASGNGLLVVAQYNANTSGTPTFTFSVQRF